MYITADADGKIIDVGTPFYIHRQANGTWGPCSPEDAPAISVSSHVYSLGEPVELDPIYDDDGALVDAHPLAPLAIVYTVPDGSLTMDMLRTANVHTANIDDLNTGVMELSDVQAQTADELSNALMEQADASAGASDEFSTALMEQGDFIADLMERVSALEGKRGE